MNTLKQEIARIQQAARETQGKYPGVNKWYEITKVAYERGELIKLLSGEDEYIYDNNGNLWLHSGGPDADLDKDPIGIAALTTSGVSVYYEKTEDDEFKESFVEAFNQMTIGTPKQIYYAVQIFAQLASDDAVESGAFYNWIDNTPFTDCLRPMLFNAIKLRKKELISSKIYNCEKDSEGVYEHCKFYSQQTEDFGIKGFIEG